jgi:hypothetical protein
MTGPNESVLVINGRKWPGKQKKSPEVRAMILENPSLSAQKKVRTGRSAEIRIKGILAYTKASCPVGLPVKKPEYPDIFRPAWTMRFVRGIQ